MDRKDVIIKWIGNTNLKLEYQVAVKTQIKAEVLNERAIVQLQEDGYKTIERNGNKIVFNDSDGPFMRMRDIPATLDEGVLGFNECDGITILQLTYFVKYSVFLVGALALIVYSFFTSFINLYGEILLLMVFVLENINKKKIAKRLFMEIIE
jgi:hypothetical protein